MHNKEGRITTTFSNLTGSSQFFYDAKGHVVALKRANQTYFIASDLHGTPLEVFDASGASLKKLQRTPLGLLLQDSNPAFSLPLGFHGQFEVHGIVLFANHDFRPYDTHLNQWMTPSVDEIVMHPHQWRDVTKIHPYRFKENECKMSYMDQYEDWLELFNLVTPMQYLENPSVFSRISIEDGYDLHQTFRRPLICTQIASDHQLLGPNIIVQYNTTDRSIRTKLLQGAGSIEQILGKLVNGSIFMQENEQQPQLLNFYVPLDVMLLAQNEIDILQKSAKVKRSSTQNEETYFMTVDANHFQMTFWIGFISIDEAELYRLQMNL